MTFAYGFYVNDTIDPTRYYSKFDGYLPGAYMILAYADRIEGADEIDALEKLYYLFNAPGARPSGYTGPSLSCGDVVILAPLEGENVGNGSSWALNSEITGKLIGVEGGWQKLESFDPKGDASKGWMNYQTYKAWQKVKP